LILPNFFDYEKKAKIIKSNLAENYNLEVIEYDKIKFKALPIPNLELNNVLLNLKSSSVNLRVKNFKIYPKLFSIYNYNNFQSSKIILIDSTLSLEISDLNFLPNVIFSKSNKILIDNLSLKILNDNKSIIQLDNINFANYGYNKNLIRGKVFEKKFKIEGDHDFKNINFKIFNTGITADVILNEKQIKNSISGVLKSKILNTNFKLNFDYDGKKIKIDNFYLRNKDVSFKKNSLIILNPFLDIDSKISIEEISFKKLKKFDFVKALQFKDFLKKINSRNEITYKSKKFTNNFIDTLDLKVDLAYGRINYNKEFLFSNNFFQCKGTINLLEEFPLLYFNCNLNAQDKKEFLKKFSIKIKEKDEFFNLNVEGNLNILNKKVNFKNISINKNYKASKEDLIYFKITFERIFFDKNIIEIFNLKKIKEFIIEIS
jgi:hypothetical protein